MDPLALAIVQGKTSGGKPTPEEVVREVFKDLGKGDDVEWVLFKNGTFYTFPKVEAFSGDDLAAQALQMSQEAELLKHDGADEVSVLPYNDIWTHPTFIVFSCLRQKIGWVIVGEDSVWPETEQQLASVGYAARQRAELDWEENKIIATSFEWSCK